MLHYIYYSYVAYKMYEYGSVAKGAFEAASFTYKIVAGTASIVSDILSHPGKEEGWILL